MISTSGRDGEEHSGSEATWVVPGAPLENGRGWRIWYSRPGEGGFEPAPLAVTRSGRSESVTVTDWDLLPQREGMGRRSGVLTLALDEPAPGELYRVTVPEAGRSFGWRSLPAAHDASVAFLLASCFYHENDKEGRYGAGMAELAKLRDPSFKFLMGDQIYQDWPPQQLDDLRSPFELYADRYAQYWGDGTFLEGLQSSPTYFGCDDHEFWNNYPQRQIQVPLSLLEPTRSSTEDAAQTLYYQYQRAANPGAARYYSFQTAGVAFFVADTRSERTRHGDADPGFLSEDQREQLAAWVGSLAGPGVLVLPQPLFQQDGDWKDYSLSNFARDHAVLCGLFEDALSGQTGDGRPHDILMLSGDIHTGRHAIGRVTGLTDDVHEFIASPASLIGPFPQRKKPSVAPGKICPDGRPSWTIWQTDEPGSPTIDNHVGAVRVSRGRNRRVRFELELWRVRPHDDRHWWERVVGDPKPQAPLVPLFHQEIELR